MDGVVVVVVVVEVVGVETATVVASPVALGRLRAAGARRQAVVVRVEGGR